MGVQILFFDIGSTLSKTRIKSFAYHNFILVFCNFAVQLSEKGSMMHDSRDHVQCEMAY